MENPQIPEHILQAFSQRFPEAETPEWEEYRSFEADFKNAEGREVEATFSNSGRLLKTETEIEVEEIPEAVLKALAEDYPNCRIKDAERVEYASGRVLYEIELKFEVHYSPEGRWLKEGKDL